MKNEHSKIDCLNHAFAIKMEYEDPEPFFESEFQSVILKNVPVDAFWSVTGNSSYIKRLFRLSEKVCVKKGRLGR